MHDSYNLADQQTGNMAFSIKNFTGGSEFNKLQQHNYFSMLLISNGQGILTRDGTEYPFSAGCLLCFSLYQSFSVSPEENFDGMLINFHPSFFCLFKHRNEVSCNGVLFNNLYDSPVVSINANELKSLLTISGQIISELQRQTPDPDVVLSYLKIFLIESSRAKLNQRHKEVSEKRPLLIDELQQAIENHFKTLRLPGDYGRLLHISEKALNKSCKMYFHKTLTRLIAERMTTEAKRELYLTAKPVKQIAFELGYHDEFYFSRFFKKNVGISPQLFRDTVGFDKMSV